MCMRCVVGGGGGFLLEFVHRLCRCVMSCVIQDIVLYIIRYNATWWPQWDYYPSFILLSCWFGHRVPTYNKGMVTFQLTPLENFSFTHPEEWPKWIRCFE